MAVPKTIINDRVEFEGAIPEREFAELRPSHDVRKRVKAASLKL